MRFAPDFGWLWGWRRLVPPRGDLSRLRAGPSVVEFIFTSGDAPGEVRLTIYGAPAVLGDGPLPGDGAGEWTGYIVSVNGGPETIYDATLPREIITAGHIEGEAVSVTIQSLGWRGRRGAIAYRTTYPAVTPPVEVYYLVDGETGDRLTDGISGAYLTSLTPPPATAPTITGIPTIVGGGVIGAPQSLTGYALSGFPIPALAYSWRIDGVEVSTASTYAPIEADDGHVLTCALTVTSTSGTDTTTTAGTSVIFAAPVSSGSLAPASLTTGAVASIDFRPRITVAGDADLSGGSWAIQAGALPIGMTHAAGVISGTPTTVESGSITLRYTNSGGHADVSCAFSVASSLAAPSYLGGATTEPANVSLLHAHAGSDYITGSSLTWSIDGSPAGWVIDTATGAVRRTPTAEGSESVTIRATNASGSASYLHTINVGPAPYVPTWSRNAAVAPAGPGRLTYDGEFGADSRIWGLRMLVSELELMPATTAYALDLNGRWTVQLFSSGLLKVLLKESASVTLVDWLSTSSIKAAGDWLIHIQANLQVGAPTFVVSRMNMALPPAERVWETVAGTATTLVAGIVENTRGDQNPDVGVLATRTSTSPLTLNLGYLAVDTTTVVAREALVSNGHLRNPATVGTPIMLFTGATALTGENLGTGPDFVSAGSWSLTSARYAPDAIGFGRYAVGARASATPAIYTVTNLNDSGTGSLRWAASQPGPSYIVCQPGLSGYINLTSGEVVIGSDRTLDLSAGNVVVSRSRIVGRGTNFVIRGVTCIAGITMPGMAVNERDGISIGNGSTPTSNYAVVHCTAMWAPDENLATWGTSVNTNSYGTWAFNLSRQGLVDSGHDQDTTGAMGHSMAFLISEFDQFTSVIHNVFVGNKWRNAMFKGGGVQGPAEFMGNLVGMGSEGMTGGPQFLIAEANIFYPSAHMSTTERPFSMDASGTPYVRVSGNVKRGSLASRNMGRTKGGGPDWNESDAGTGILMTTDPFTRTYTSAAAATIEPIVLARAGARCASKRRDFEIYAFDQLVNDSPAIPPLPAADIVWPTLPATSLAADSNADGLPDEFETAVRERWGITPTPHGQCPFGGWKSFSWFEIFQARARGEITDLAAAA